MPLSAPPNLMGETLRCPYCNGAVSVDVEITTLQTYFIKERIEVIEKDGSPGSPTFLTSAPHPAPRDKVYKTIRCTGCNRTFYEAGRSIKLDPIYLRVELEYFTEELFRSWDVAPKPKERFLLKSRPRETV